MIIYGTRSKELAKELLVDKCPNCGTQNSVDLHVFQKYAHIFFVPLFPIGKTGVSGCSHCKQVLKLKEMPPSLVNSYDRLKAQTKTPVWTFAGLGVIAVLIVLLVINDKQKDEKNAKLILAPKTGDIFEIRTKENQFTLYKIEEIQGDSVFIRTNNFETNKLSGINDLKSKGDTSYSQEVYGFSKAELKKMLADGEIIDIDRK